MGSSVRTFIGILVLAFICWIDAIVNRGGGFLSFILLSIICTLGFGVIPWLLVSYVIGTIVDGILLLIVPSILKPVHEKRELAQQAKKLQKQLGKTPNVEKMLNPVEMYILKARSMDKTDEEIRAKLTKNGWTEAEIDDAYTTIGLL